MRLPPPFLAVTGALLAPLLLPNVAGASSATTTRVEHPEQRHHSTTPVETVVRWTGDPGEANRVVLTYEPRDGLVVFSDPAAPIRPLDGCEARPGGAVACRAWSEETSIELYGGDGDDLLHVPEGRDVKRVFGGEGDDTLTVADSDLHPWTLTLDGGPGADTITGGRTGETIDGGPGSDTIAGGAASDTIADDPAAGPFSADRIDGGDGNDEVVYARSSGVEVDLSADRGGAPGEGDLLLSVESATGGSGDDVLLGTDEDNTLYGGSGDDLLDGGAGDDDLSVHGGAGARILAGVGDDEIFRTSGQIDCGEGDDRITLPRPGAIVPAGGCERIDSHAFEQRPPRYDGRRLLLTLRWSQEWTEATPRCGAVVSVRTADAAARLLARRTVPVPAVGWHRRAVVPARPLPPQVRVRLRVTRCPDGGPPRIRRSSVPIAFTLALRPPALTTASGRTGR